MAFSKDKLCRVLVQSCTTEVATSLARNHRLGFKATNQYVVKEEYAQNLTLIMAVYNANNSWT